MSWHVPGEVRSDLRDRLRTIPRLRVAHLPTPLEHCPRLSRALGGPEIFVKRDDCTGLAFGGNKARQLEFVIAEALGAGADTIVTGSGSQSNWCRQAAAMARKCGLDVSLVLATGEKGAQCQGNLLLDYLLGADVTFIESRDLHDVQMALADKVTQLRERGARPYLMNPFALETKSLAALGYVDAMLELQEQVSSVGVEPSHVYVPGANITPAGLLVGATALRIAVRITSFSPVRWQEDRRADIAAVASASAARLSLAADFPPGDISNDDSYVGERYGHLSDACADAMRLMADAEGIVLDPVYSGKAMAGLIDYIRSGRLTTRETVVFVHTGGTPALFAYAADLEARLVRVSSEREDQGPH